MFGGHLFGGGGAVKFKKLKRLDCSQKYLISSVLTDKLVLALRHHITMFIQDEERVSIKQEIMTFLWNSGSLSCSQHDSWHKKNAQSGEKISIDHLYIFIYSLFWLQQEPKVS